MVEKDKAMNQGHANGGFIPEEDQKVRNMSSTFNSNNKYKSVTLLGKWFK